MCAKLNPDCPLVPCRSRPVVNAAANDTLVTTPFPVDSTAGRPCEQGPKSTNFVSRLGGTVDFVIRPLEEGDLPACVELLRGHLAYPAAPTFPNVLER